jgi:predicted aspartyl protease
MTNLGHIENRRGVKVLGLIGFGMLKDFEIIFDPLQDQLELYKVDNSGKRFTPYSSRFKTDYSCKFEFLNNILFIRTIVGDKNLRFCIDTGAETNVIDRFAPKSVMNSITITRRATLTGAGSYSSEVLFGSMNGLLFGSNKIDNQETIITNLDPLSEAYDKKIDGMLGYPFLSKGSFCINFVKKELSICFYNEATI